MTEIYCPVQGCDYAAESVAKVQGHINGTPSPDHDWSDLKPHVMEQAEEDVEKDNETNGSDEPEKTNSGQSDGSEENDMVSDKELAKQRQQAQGDSDGDGDSDGSGGSGISIPVNGTTLAVGVGLLAAAALYRAHRSGGSTPSTDSTDTTESDAENQAPTAPSGGFAAPPRGDD